MQSLNSWPPNLAKLWREDAGACLSVQKAFCQKDGRRVWWELGPPCRFRPCWKRSHGRIWCGLDLCGSSWRVESQGTRCSRIRWAISFLRSRRDWLATGLMGQRRGQKLMRTMARSGTFWCLTAGAPLGIWGSWRWRKFGYFKDGALLTSGVRDQWPRLWLKGVAPLEWRPLLLCCCAQATS